MTGLLGGGLVTGACLWLGWSRCRWYAKRAETLSQLCGDLARMEAELGERETDTEALLTLLSEGTGVTADCYRRCRDGLHSGLEGSFAALWDRALEESGFPLCPEERAIVARAGQILGRYTGREQAVLLSGLRRELEVCRQSAREEGRQQGKTAVVLGLTLGLTLALILA